MTRFLLYACQENRTTKIVKSKQRSWLTRHQQACTVGLMQAELIQTAIAHTGGTQASLAQAGGFSQQAVSRWMKGHRVGLAAAIAIERVTAGAVKCEQLRADVNWSGLRG